MKKKFTKLWHLYLNYEIKSSNNNDVHELDKQFIALKGKLDVKVDRIECGIITLPSHSVI